MASNSINCVEFISSIIERKGCQFAGWRVENSVSLTGGKKCPYVGATKIADVGVSIGVDWNKRAEQAGRALESRTWGVRVGKLPLVIHTPKGQDEAKLYVTTEVNSYNLIGYYDCSGNEIIANDIEPWLVKRSTSDIGNYADYSLSSITAIYRKIDGIRTTLILDHSDLQDAIALLR